MPLVTMPDSDDATNKTNSGGGILAFGSNCVERLWKSVRNEQNPSEKATASVIPQHWQPNTNILMTNDISGVNLEEVVPCIVLSKNDSYVMSAGGGKVCLFIMMTFKFEVPHDADDDVILGRDGSMKYSDCPVGDSLSDLLIHIFCKLPLKSVVACYDTCPSFQVDSHHKLFGSVNGVMFLRSHFGFLLMNQTTGEHIEIELHDGFVEHHEYYEYENLEEYVTDPRQVTYGFGRCEKGYKIILITQLDGSYLLCYIRIVGDSHWREVPMDTSLHYIFDERIVPWLVEDEESTPHILFFGLRDETFGRYKAPLGSLVGQNVTISILNQQLTIFDSTHQDFCIWSMKKYGDDSSWCKVFVSGGVFTGD
ncbi:hypothetical protein OROGR_002489 [Orobanche gracilis]